LKYFRTMIRLLMVLVCASALLSIVQAYFLGFGRGDLSSGSLRSGPAAVVGMSIICLVIGLAMSGKKIKIGYVLIPALLIFSFILGGARAAFFFLPVALMFQLRRYWIKEPVRAVTIVILFSLMFSVFLKYETVLIDDPQGHSVMPYLRSPQATLGYLTDVIVEPDGEVYVGRFAALDISVRRISETLTTLMFGMGPGSVSPSTIATSIYNEDLVELELYRWSASRTVIELGLLGVLSFGWLFLKLFLINRRLARMTAADSFWRGISWGFDGILILLIATSIYTETWAMDATTWLFWLTAAAVIKATQTFNYRAKNA